MADLNRRAFLGTTAAAGAMLYAGRSAAARSSFSDIRVAVVGLRSRGRAHLQQLGSCVAALCDVDEKVLTQTRDALAESSGKRLPTYVDYRKLVEDPSIDAVSVATPNHTHAIIAIAAMQAGKDVYLEKPVSHHVWEGSQIVAAAERYGRVAQCGTQSRSSSSLAEAVRWVRSGQLGKIEYVQGTCYKPRKAIGKLSSPLKIPDHIHFDLWCGPAALDPIYRPSLHYDWHWDFNTGNGDLGNQGVHQVDIARWFLGEQRPPKRVLSIGGRFGYDDAGDTPNTQVAYFDFPTAPLIFETRGLPRSKNAQSDWKDSMDSYRGSQIGVIVQCEKGHVLVHNYTSASAYDNESRRIKHWNHGGDHFGNWLAAVEKRDPSLLAGKIEDGHLSSALCHLASVSHLLAEDVSAAEAAERTAGNDLLAAAQDRMVTHLRANQVEPELNTAPLRFGRWLQVDPSGLEAVGDSEATALFRRNCRKPFEVPAIV